VILGLNMDHGATLKIESRGHKSMDRVKVSDDGNAVGLTSNPRFSIESSLCSSYCLHSIVVYSYFTVRFGSLPATQVRSVIP